MAAATTTTTTTITTTTTRVYDDPTCLVITSLVLGILVAAGSIVPFNPGLCAIGLLSAVGSALYLFACSPAVRVVAYWVLFCAMIMEALAAVALIGFGIALTANPKFLGLGFFFGVISLVLAVPVIAMTLIDLMTVIRIHPIVFAARSGETTSSSDLEVAKGASAQDESTGTDAAEEETESSAASQKLPLLDLK